ncbi:Trans-aconitate 2-methyltransferase [subsurface metagenome]
MNAKKQGIPPYYNFPRPEIQALVPREAKTILDLGCASGRLGAELKKRQDCAVHGVDFNPEMLKEAKKRLDWVHLANLDALDWKVVNREWDCIIFGDILEHLINPWAVLHQANKLLSPDGLIVASIPNIAHPRMVENLKRGLFRYTPYGICDSDHKRFFTKTSITQMFSQEELKITHLEPWPLPEDPQSFLIKAKPTDGRYAKPQVTIIIVTYNKLNYLAACIESIRKNTTHPHKIIVVDNGSKDGTIAWLRKQEDILTIENEHNLGFTIGNNLAMSMLNTPLFCLLNNDTIVTHGWLNRLAYVLESQDSIKAVGPTTNYISGPQQDNNAQYATIEDMEKYAAKILLRPSNLMQRSPRLVFFCTLLKTKLIRTIGLLDEIFSPGNFEDDDYCMRINQAKGSTIISRSVFIHHYGQTSWRSNPQAYADLMRRNQKLFRAKWNL